MDDDEEVTVSSKLWSFGGLLARLPLTLMRILSLITPPWW